MIRVHLPDLRSYQDHSKRREEIYKWFKDRSIRIGSRIFDSTENDQDDRVYPSLVELDSDAIISTWIFPDSFEDEAIMFKLIFG